MKLSRYASSLITLCLLISAKEQFGQAYKFDFGSGKAAPGYIRITPESTFNYKTGYGFGQGSVVESVDRGGDALTGDFITSEITPNKTATTIFLAGNSTVVDQDREPWCAWGQIFPRFLIPSKVVVANYAESGETLRAFKGERRLEKIWSLLKPGDYLFIEFAHNDQKPGSSHLDPFTTYKETLKEWIMEARKRKVNPVLVTSMHRRTFDSSGHITNSLLEYPEAMRQTGREENVPVIDLNAMSKILYENLGPEQTLKAFVHFPANSFPNQPEALKDNTHFTPYGATELAKCIVQSIRQQKLPLASYIRKEVPNYDPAHPLSPSTFYWPQSPLVAAVKPDGN